MEPRCILRAFRRRVLRVMHFGCMTPYRTHADDDGLPSALMRAVVIALVALIATACSSAAAPTSPSVAPAASPSTAQPEPSASGSSATPAIVGEWVGTHDCARIVKMLTDAGLQENLGDAIYGNGLVPGADTNTKTVKDVAHVCDNAVQRKHSHFFTADGQFGSKDFNGQQVDDGPYRLQGDDVVVIGDQPFHYSIDGDELTLVPPKVDISGCTTEECRFPATWVLMVAMPGTTWKRGEIPVS
jgi:hypothetical protein